MVRCFLFPAAIRVGRELLYGANRSYHSFLLLIRLRDEKVTFLDATVVIMTM